MVTRRSPLYRGSGLALVACGALAAMTRPGLSAPGRARGPRPLPAPAPRTAPKPLLPAVPPPGNQIMPVSEVKPGMTGYGLTVFRGTTIERFGVTVVDVLPKSNMGQPLVLVRLTGGPISKRGAYLIQGMSGSPIYVNGKLLGAFSMGDAWPKDALGMVTPIEDMMEALDPKLSPVPAGATAFGPAPGAPEFASAESGLFQPPVERDPISAAGGRFRPLSIPVTVSGLSPRNLDRVAGVLRPYNMTVLQGPGSSGKPFKASLVPGAAIGVALLSGDVDMTGIGTVTYRKGDEILAFGHPMMQIGAAQFPITTAFIHDVFSGFQVSHKIGSAGEMCGTLTQDRPFSIAGKVGPMPATIPIRCNVKDQATGRTRTFNIRSANHPLLVGQLLPIAVNQSLFTMRPVPGDALARVKLTVETDGAGTITRDNLFFDPQAIDIAAVRELQELLGVLASNSFRRVPVKRLDVDVTVEERRPTATVERIFLTQDRFEPGDEVEVGVVVRPYRKDPVVMRTKVRIPESAENGRALLMVQGGATRVNLTALMSGGAPGSLAPTGPPPDASLRQILKRFADRERNDQLVTRLIFPTAAVNVNGERLSQLPSTIVELMRSSKTTGFRIERDEEKKKQDTEYVVDGVQTLSVTIQKADHLERMRPAGGSGSGSPASGGGFSAPGSSSGAVSLSGGDEVDLAERPDTIRFTVNGQPRAVRLMTPEDDEPEESPARAGRDGSKKTERKDEKKPNIRDRGKTPVKPAVKAEPAPTPERDAKPAPAADDKLVGRPAVQWTQTSQADFERGTRRNTAVTTDGEVCLAPALQLIHESSEQFIWSVVGIGGAAYAGTGNGGQVLKIDAAGKASVFCRTGELEVHAMTRDRAGNLYAGTSPNGKVFKITPDGKATEILSMNGAAVASESGGKFVLSLAVAGDGTVFAGTGPEGKVYRIAPGGQPEVFATLRDKAVMSLLLTPSGALYAGTAEGGSIYRIQPDGPTMVYDTDQDVISGLAMDGAGNLYAACAPSGEVYKIEPNGTPRLHFNKTKGTLFGLLADPGGNLYTCAADAVLRIEPDGNAAFLTDGKKRAQFTCLAWDDQSRMLLGSANVGSVYRLGAAATGTFESTVHDAKLPAQWGRIRFTGVLPPNGTLKMQTRSGNTSEPDPTWSAWQEPQARDGGFFVGSPAARFLQYRFLFEAESGSPALRDVTVSYLPRNSQPKLALTAPLGGEILRGTFQLKWTATDADKDTLTYEVSYSDDSGQTWKAVGAATGPAEAPRSGAGVPTRSSADAALQQYRDQLDKDSTLTPQQRQESFEKAKALIDQYFKENPLPAAPEKPSAAPAPPASAGPTGGSTRQTTLSWDTRSVPDGIYVLRVVASDRASNPRDAQADGRITEPFIVANTAPQLFVFQQTVGTEGLKGAQIVGFAAGRVALKGAQYRLNGGEWTAIDPEDGIWDSAFEHFRFNIAPSRSGEHTLEVKVVDAAGNVQTGKATFKAP